MIFISLKDGRWPCALKGFVSGCTSIGYAETDYSKLSGAFLPGHTYLPPRPAALRPSPIPVMVRTQVPTDVKVPEPQPP